MSIWSNTQPIPIKEEEPKVFGVIVKNGPRWKGPRNLPKPDHRKFVRKRAKAARKVNRGAYSGQ